MIKQFDVWLVEDVAERFTHWFQKLTGKNNFWLARVCAWQLLFFPAFLLSLDMILRGSIDALLSNAALPGSFFVLSITTVSYILVIRIAEKAVRKARKHSCMNPLKSTQQGIRYRFSNMLWWSVVLAGVLVFTDLGGYGGMVVALTVLFYIIWIFPIIVIMHLMSCDSLPPSSEKSKITKWLAAIRAYVTPTPQPVSAPSS